MSEIDLLTLFNSVTGALKDNKDSLNKADTYNGDHGTNMVEIFNVITKAIKKKDTKDPSEQLAYASKILGKKKSGSAQVYAQGLAEAANQFKGEKVTQNNAMQLIQTFLGGGEAAPSTNPLEGLLGGILGGGQTQKEDSGFDVGDLMNAGMAYMAAKNSGDSSVEAILDAVVSATPLGQSAHRAQSGKIVTNSLLEVLGSLTGKK